MSQLTAGAEPSATSVRSASPEGSQGRRIVAVVLLVWFGGKVLALGKDVVIAYFFGASSATDAYFIATNVPTLVYAGVLASVPVVLLPLYSARLADGYDAAAALINRAVNWYALVAVVLSCSVFVAAGLLVDVMAPSIPLATRHLAINLTRIFSLTFLFTIVAAVLTTIQLAHKQAVAVQAIPIVNHAMFIAITALFARRFGIYAAATAAAIGWLVQVPLQAHRVRKWYRYSFQWKLSRNERRVLLGAFAPALVSVSIDQVNPLISVYFASAGGQGAVALLAFALRILSVATGVFIVVASNIAYPEFSRLVAAGDNEIFASEVMLLARRVFAGSVLGAVALMVCSRPIVGVILERGAMTEGDAAAVATLLLVLATAIPFIAVREVLTRALYARGSLRSAVVVASSALVSTVATCYALRDMLGITAIAIAIVVGSGVSGMVAWAGFRRQLSDSGTNNKGIVWVKIVGAGGVSLMCAAAATAWVTSASDLVQVTVGGCCALVTYTVCLQLGGLLKIDWRSRSISGEIVGAD